MTPIPAVDLTAMLTKLAAPGAAASPNVSPDMASKFQALMNRDKADAPLHAEPSHNVLGHMIEDQQRDMRDLNSQMDRFVVDAPNMTVQELSAAQMSLSNQFVQAGAKFTVATSITQGARKSLDGLLKNQ